MPYYVANQTTPATATVDTGIVVPTPDTTVIEPVELDTHTPYIKGYADGTFRPNAFVKRAQMAAMLARNLSDDIDTSATATYSTTTGGHLHLY